MRRMGSVEDLVGGIVFMASDDARDTLGPELSIDCEVPALSAASTDVLNCWQQCTELSLRAAETRSWTA